MSTIREKMLNYVKSVVEKSTDKLVEIRCEDIVSTLNIAPTTCYLYLRVVCKEVGGKYNRGACVVIKP
jgi:transcriptional regulator CtsR